ncbi:hypothetical protein EMIHUDRAFT_238785 [Emiliania huxleyi CCMP1516]|nr:hypothetical protein EMIHUDRAFT_238785 [Emiliania huxleyi CCMP1516]EOD24242.1 hypothetical protein EMIHUDRAFT_238785 [Emiliania huxleyi CCMP1516]|eukprot:XP_005776671.1 hypothetical protein EMIHUDRAFT_238785 [Emiliania huxleyi CCMP1516]
MSAASSKMAFGPPGRVLGGAASAWVLLFNADQPDEVSSKLLSSLPHATAQLLAVTATLLTAGGRPTLLPNSSLSAPAQGVYTMQSRPLGHGRRTYLADSRDAASPAAAPAQWSASQLQTLCHAARFQLAHLPAGAT